MAHATASVTGAPVQPLRRRRHGRGSTRAAWHLRPRRPPALPPLLPASGHATARVVPSSSRRRQPLLAGRLPQLQLQPRQHGLAGSTVSLCAVPTQTPRFRGTPARAGGTPRRTCGPSTVVPLMVEGPPRMAATCSRARRRRCTCSGCRMLFRPIATPGPQKPDGRSMTQRLSAGGNLTLRNSWMSLTRGTYPQSAVHHLLT